MGLTSTFRPKLYSDNCYYIDMSGWDYMVVQVIAGELTPYISNDGGAITGSVDDAAITAINFIQTGGFKVLSTGQTYSQSTMLAGDLYKIENIGRYVKLDSSFIGSPDAIVMLYKKV